jgi:hypothetical protein
LKNSTNIEKNKENFIYCIFLGGLNTTGRNFVTFSQTGFSFKNIGYSLRK